MDEPGRETDGQSQQFEVIVTGSVDPDVLTDIADVEIFPQQMSTVLSGRFEDQAGLYRLLARLQSFAFEIVEIRRVGPDE